jgi:hypothetical protein
MKLPRLPHILAVCKRRESVVDKGGGGISAKIWINPLLVGGKRTLGMQFPLPGMGVKNTFAGHGIIAWRVKGGSVS